MQESVSGDTGAERPAHAPAPAESPSAEGASAATNGAGTEHQRVRQDWRARHLSPHTQVVNSTPKEDYSEEADDGGTQEGGAVADRLGRQLWSWTKELLTIVVIAIVLSFLIKTFLFRAFYIPSGSMENTLQIDDRIFVNLLVPEPFSLKRGDVVVFKDTLGWLPPTVPKDGPFNWVNDVATFIGLAPDSSEQHLVKRVIGMPGDHVTCCSADGKLTINGEPITEPYLFPGAVPSEMTFDVTVPEGHLWVMGDHRNNSEDSRAHEAASGNGFVPIDDVEGRAVVIAWPLSHWGILGNYPDVFTNVPEPSSSSVSSSRHAPAGQ